MQDLIQSGSEYTASNDSTPRENTVSVLTAPSEVMSNADTINIGAEVRPKARYRAASLSYDWDNVVTCLDSGQKIRKVTPIDHLEEGSEVRHPGCVQIERTKHTFVGGSSYTGQWNAIGMAGKGNFLFLHDVDYEGNLRDGMFHGEGTLSYPMGQKIEGQWAKGKLVAFKFIFADDLEYDDPWKYCKMPDRRSISRRFYTSILEGLRPAGRSLLTNNNPARKIPEGCYDTGDGFYNPATKCVWSAIKPNKILRVPTAAEEKWIMENCRKAWDEPTGYAPQLFEHWVSGRRSDSAFQEPKVDVARPVKTNTDSDASLNINVIVSPTYNVSPVSSSSWLDSHGVPTQI